MFVEKHSQKIFDMSMQNGSYLLNIGWGVSYIPRAISKSTTKWFATSSKMCRKFLFVNPCDHGGEFLGDCTPAKSLQLSWRQWRLLSICKALTLPILLDCSTLLHIECVLAQSYSSLFMSSTIAMATQYTTFTSCMLLISNFWNKLL